MIKSEKNVKITKKKASTICGCGCKVFVWWVPELQCWTSNTVCDKYVGNGDENCGICEHSKECHE